MFKLAREVQPEKGYANNLLDKSRPLPLITYTTLSERRVLKSNLQARSFANRANWLSRDRAKNHKVNIPPKTHERADPR